MRVAMADPCDYCRTDTLKNGTGRLFFVATLGGKRGPGTEERRFLVPADEYQVGRFGFVIDETRHPLYGGLSSFIGWQP